LEYVGKAVGLVGVDWIHVAQDRITETDSFEHRNKPAGSIKGEKFLDYLQGNITF
jgi:hypothetical protein